MKRISSALKSITYQIKIDDYQLEKKDGAFPRIEEVLNLREFLSLLAPSLNREELIYFSKLFLSEIEVRDSARTSFLCEMIPASLMIIEAKISDECWMSIFRLVSKDEDLSQVFRFREVNQRWYNSVASSFIEATIDRPQSEKGIASLSNLQSLIIKSDCSISLDAFSKSFTNLRSLRLKGGFITSPDIPSQAWSRMTNLTSLELSDNNLHTTLINADNIILLTNLRSLTICTNKNDNTSSSIINVRNLSHLSQLTELNTWDDDELSLATLEKRYGVNYKILESLKELKVANLQLFHNLDCRQIQENHPEVRFRWCYKGYNNFVNHYYEGEFAGRNTYEGKGSFYFPSGSRYEGDMKGDRREGKGVFFFTDGSRYEGDWKKGYREGIGILDYSNGDRYEGDWVYGQKEGKGLMVYSNGDRYQGGWKNDKKEGKGVYTESNGKEYEGEWKNDERVI